ncbi:MAG: phosphatidylglycerol:prolipoprotein diacylglycerol transferase [Pelagibacterales bacterium]|jgi:phosphatidylglycerol:prolipoprotein diacylglycerol transferase|nr:phosphatidylglycerol:prolipoprotein diacylglycerol transferase [Pelagibacterales bacterium]
MYTHNLDPVLFDFGFFIVRWYSLAYISGILIGWWLGKKIILRKFQDLDFKFDIKEFDNLITYLIISILIGGRIGYVIFYNFGYYLTNPIDVIKIWEGGMSFHGALLGIIFGTFLFAFKKKLPTYFLLDIIACVSPIGIFFGRIANFINGELVGKTTNVFWGVVFPKIDNFARHPSQLYEAFLEGLILLIIMNLFLFKKKYKTGTCSYMFLIFYGCFRIFSESFREPDAQVGYLFNLVSMGTFLSIFMVLVGAIIFLKKNDI